MGSVKRLLSILDEIEASNGPGVLVTTAAGPRHFSTGFDLPYWAKSFENLKASLTACLEVMARLLEFPMPTLCVFNGNAIAGGYLLGLCHDMRIMHESVGSICLSELKIGMAFPYPYMHVTRSKLRPMVTTKVLYGVTLKQKEALKDGLIDDTYKDRADLESKLAAYAKRYAQLGAMRQAVKLNKQHQYEASIKACRSFTMDPIFEAHMRAFHAGPLQGFLKQLQKAKKPAQPRPKL